MTHILLLLLLPLKVWETNRFLQSCFAATLISRPMTSQRLRLKSQPDDKTRPCLKSQPDDLVVAKFPQRERSYIVDLATDHSPYSSSSSSILWAEALWLKCWGSSCCWKTTSCGWLLFDKMKSMNFYCTSGGCEMGSWERESVIREHVLLSHITLKDFFCLWYIPSTSKKWQKDVSDGNVKTHLVKT